MATRRRVTRSRHPITLLMVIDVPFSLTLAWLTTGALAVLLLW